MFGSVNKFLENFCFFVVSEMLVLVWLMENSVVEMLMVFDLNGFVDWLSVVNFYYSVIYSYIFKVVGIVGVFVRYLGWNEKDCCEVVVGGLIYDIGKMCILLIILDKFSELFDVEWKIINKYLVFG